MTHPIDELIQKMKVLEDEMEVEFKKKRENFHFILEEKRIRFADEVARQQRRFKTGLFRYFIDARPMNLLTAPVIYAGFLPFIILDIFLYVYQDLCFPIYGIPKVRRADYMVFDR